MASALNLVEPDRAQRATPLFVCAWCGTPIDGRRHAAAQPVNFGMCVRCVRREVAALPDRRQQGR